MTAHLTLGERCAHGRRTAVGFYAASTDGGSTMESLLGGGLFVLFLIAQALAVVALQGGGSGEPPAQSN